MVAIFNAQKMTLNDARAWQNTLQSEVTIAASRPGAKLPRTILQVAQGTNSTTISGD